MTTRIFNDKRGPSVYAGLLSHPAPPPYGIGVLPPNDVHEIVHDDEGLLPAGVQRLHGGAALVREHLVPDLGGVGGVVGGAAAGLLLRHVSELKLRAEYVTDRRSTSES